MGPPCSDYTAADGSNTFNTDTGLITFYFIIFLVLVKAAENVRLLVIPVIQQKTPGVYDFMV